MATARAEDGKHLFILSGQSNMDRLDPALSFTPAVEEAFGAEGVIVVKDAQGGRPIRQWYKAWRPAEGDQPQATGDLYDRLMAKVKPAIEGENIQTVTFIWMQGERDANEGHGAVYQASLEGLIEQLSADLGRDDINVVIGRLSDYSNPKYEHWDQVRAAQEAFVQAGKNRRLDNTDDLNDLTTSTGKTKNDLHYSKEGYRTLGTRFAESSIEMINQAP